jgi:hypothetical protein
MNLSLNKRLNSLFSQYISAPPEVAEAVVQWMDDWQKETSAVDHENLRTDIKDLHADVSRLKDQFYTLDKNMVLLRSELKEDIQSVRSELKEDIQSVRSELKEDVHVLGKSISGLKIMMSAVLLLLTALLLPVYGPLLHKLLQ